MTAAQYDIVIVGDGHADAQATKDYAAGGALVVARTRANPRALANPEVPLKSLAASPPSLAMADAA